MSNIQMLQFLFDAYKQGDFSDITEFCQAVGTTQSSIMARLNVFMGRQWRYCKLIEVHEIEVPDTLREVSADLDFQSLLEHIRHNGLLEPITITSNKTLIHGARRLKCFEILGWKKIPCEVQ